MSRWTLRFALALACWLPLQTALAWLPVQQPVRVDVSTPDSSRTSSFSAQALGAASPSDCHSMVHASSDAGGDAAASKHACPPLSQWMEHGSKHCNACVQIAADLPRVALLADWLPRHTDGAPEFHPARYANFIPGIPVPPPCHFVA